MIILLSAVLFGAYAPKHIIPHFSAKVKTGKPTVSRKTVLKALLSDLPGETRQSAAKKPRRYLAGQKYR